MFSTSRPVQARKLSEVTAAIQVSPAPTFAAAFAAALSACPFSSSHTPPAAATARPPSAAFAPVSRPAAPAAGVHPSARVPVRPRRAS